MTDWTPQTLGEISDRVGGIIQTGPFGSQLHESDYSNEGTPVVMPKDIIDGRIIEDGIARVPPQHVHRLSRHRFNPGDIVYGRRGDIGRHALIRPEQAGWLCGTGCLRISLGDSVVEPIFLHYYLFQADVIAWIANQAIGATLPNLNTGILRSVPIRLPPLTTQHKIAAILSAYDDLIENNLRRIKILEEMAQNLYREWFVKFRFPGHQDARFTDSPLGRIPEGCKVHEMREVADVIDCLHSKKPERNSGGSGLLLQLCNIGDGGTIDLSDKFFIKDSDYRKWTSRIEVQAGDCVITNVGRVAAVAQIPEGLKAALGRNMTAVRPRAGTVGPTYLIEYLLSPHMEMEVQIKKDAGSIMDSLNVKGIVRLFVPVGPPALMSLFEETARPMRALVERLLAENLNLRRTRNLLLPKLISGEVDVSQLDIAAVKVAGA